MNRISPAQQKYMAYVAANQARIHQVGFEGVAVVNGKKVTAQVLIDAGLLVLTGENACGVRFVKVAS